MCEASRKSKDAGRLRILKLSCIASVVAEKRKLESWRSKTRLKKEPDISSTPNL